MKNRVFDLLLLLVVITGGVVAWQTGRKQSDLRKEYERLAQILGDLPIADPSKLHIKALRTGEPLNFAWRVYLPPNYRLIVSTNSGSHGSSWSSEARQFIARVRVRESEQGLLQVYTHFHGGSSRMSLGDKKLAELLRGHWHKIHAEQVGANDVVALEQDQSLVLLKLTLSDDLQVEARKKLAAHLQTSYVPVLFEFGIGPQPFKK